MAATTTGLRAYLRLPEDDPENLAVYLNAARSKARAAGVPDYEENAQYDMFLYVLAGAYYDNRGIDAADQRNLQKLIDSFVLELRYAGGDTTSMGGAE